MICRPSTKQGIGIYHGNPIGFFTTYQLKTHGRVGGRCIKCPTGHPRMFGSGRRAICFRVGARVGPTPSANMLNRWFKQPFDSPQGRAALVVSMHPALAIQTKAPLVAVCPRICDLLLAWIPGNRSRYLSNPPLKARFAELWLWHNSASHELTWSLIQDLPGRSFSFYRDYRDPERQGPFEQNWRKFVMEESYLTGIFAQRLGFLSPLSYQVLQGGYLDGSVCIWRVSH